MWPFSQKIKSSPQSPKKAIVKNPQNFEDIFSSGILESFSGNKFEGGFGKTRIYVDGTIDYNMLRWRSTQLYIENLYAKGLINRLVINSINTGLKLQANPVNEIIGMEEDQLQEWSEDIEARFSLWNEDPLLVDYQNENDFATLQWIIYLHAKLSGDVLVVAKVVKPFMLPQIQVIDGRHVKTPFNVDTKNKTIKNGIEFDSQNRIVAYWVQNKRIPAFGEKSKRRIAWMVYGTKKLIDHTRGIPLLACALQALREVDRYTDSELRASFLNSIFAAWIKRTDTVGQMPQFGRAAVTNQDVDATNPDGTVKTSTFSQYLPGVLLDKLEAGEEPVSFDSKRPNLNFGEFVKVILAGVAWGNGLPPEIYMLEFKNNFSASRQASNEFKTFLNADRAFFGKQFCKPYYDEWLTDYALLGKTVMPGYLESIRDPMQWEMKNAWRKARWIGVSRPSVDPLKEINAFVGAVDNNFMSTSDAIMELRGDDFDKVIRRKASEQAKIDEMLGSDPEELIADPDDPENVLEIGA